MKAVLILAGPLVLLSLTSACPAQSTGAAQSLTIGPSIRAAGAGRSSVAVFWGGDPDYWANPALLGYHQGIRYDHGTTRLVPDLADDVYFKSDRFNILSIRRGDVDDRAGDIRGPTWGWGLGFQVADLGGIRYDRAEVPQARALERVQRSGLTVFVKPWGIQREFARSPRSHRKGR